MGKLTKSERVSFRCTKREKEKLEYRAEKLGMSLTDYAAKILFSDENDCKGLIPLIIEIQDVVSIIEEKTIIIYVLIFLEQRLWSWQSWMV